MLRSGLFARGRSWLALTRLLPLAGWPVLAWSVAVNLLIGLLPVGFIVATSVMLDRVPALGGPPPDQEAWAAVVTAFGLAFAALVTQNAVSPLQAALAELVTRRVDGQCLRRFMVACLSTAPLVVLERGDVLDRLGLVRQYLLERMRTPGAGVAGLLALIGRYAQIIGSAVLVGVVLGPVAGMVIAVVAAVIRVSSRGSLSRWSAIVRSSFRGPQRRMRYVLETGSDPAAGKEVRVLGILPWLRRRAEAESEAFLRPWWEARRQIYFVPFLVFTAVVFAGTVVVLLQLRSAAVGGVSILGLSLAVQAILVPLRMGTFYPESDLQTMFGMLANDTLHELEQLFRAGGRPTADGRPAAGLPTMAIRFEGVHFRYPGGEHDVLRGLDLELAAGCATAIVGLNGAGKTTLVKLLAGLYQPTAGRITVDGIDLRDLDPRGWRRRLAVIFQDYVRYELDAAANITLGGDREASLRAAAAWAGAEDVLATLPDGLATPLSSRYAGGVDLSGGQWQRIALARALFAVGAGASVLVLDEPTAQLDVRAEVAFFDRFIDLTQGLTSVVVSHRFSTVRRADRIVVLAGGRVVEDGDHAELMRQDGRYAELFRFQARRFTVEELGTGRQEAQ